MLAGNLYDKIVYSKDMLRLGKVKNFEINPDGMKVTHFIVKLEKEAANQLLGKRPRLRQAKVRVKTENIENMKDAIILGQSAEELKGTIDKM
ncbi:PRC-barrel domain-containing protein [[Eubacterium] cellulosolvens]